MSLAVSEFNLEEYIAVHVLQLHTLLRTPDALMWGEGVGGG